jgi:hypothetical protein
MGGGDSGTGGYNNGKGPRYSGGEDGLRKSHPAGDCRGEAGEVA